MAARGARSLRPFAKPSTILNPQRAFLSLNNRSYHSYDHDPPPPPYSAVESSILSASMRHVPKHGFTNTSLTLGAKDAGYLDVSINLFPRGAFDLINFHIVTERLALKHVGFEAAGGKEPGVARKIRTLVLERLARNRPVNHRWQEALAIMAQPSNIPTSVAELARLSDEMWFLAGDSSVDTSWYTKRATLSSIYASTELFMTQDTSSNFTETEQFLDRRLEDVRKIGSGISNLGQWLDFTGHAVTNVLRSKGVRI
ncbi:MAG: Ubiquinone biosynthesis protein coq9, mitochondrial [Sclerophora amabilis]|nr:MAG: Ubiquinone biosynthesis protein coq9, mitochondrial [Sclerophora amabilis]